MAHPQLHSKSSAKKFGGKWEDYIHLHEYTDEEYIKIIEIIRTHKVLPQSTDIFQEIRLSYNEGYAAAIWQ